MKTYSTLLLTLAAAFPAMAADDVHRVIPGREAEPARREQIKIEPANQGISLKDLVTTRDINQLISFSNALSATAHEVRVNTYRGRVTLRGAVESPEEKQQIGKARPKCRGDGQYPQRAKGQAGVIEKLS